MIIGHIGVAFIAKRSWPTVPLRVLLVATFAPDLARLALVPFGVPSSLSNIYTHMLPWSLGIMALAAAGAWLWTRNADALLASIMLVAAHCVLDIVSGTKSLWPGAPRGWNLDSRYWQYEMLIECAIALVGWWVMRPVVTPALRRVRVLVALAAVQFAVLMIGLNSRPYLYRCFAYPFRSCDDTSELTRRWAGTLLPNPS